MSPPLPLPFEGRGKEAEAFPCEKSFCFYVFSVRDTTPPLTPPLRGEGNRGQADWIGWYAGVSPAVKASRQNFHYPLASPREIFFCDFCVFRVRFLSLFAAAERGVCQKFSHRVALWRRFFAAAVLRAGKSGKWAYFESLLGISGLERGFLSKGVKKVLGQHGMPTNKTKNEGEN